MRKCPDCQYQTNHPDHMEKHQKKYGHGGCRSKKVWRGHNKVSGSKKGGGGKNKGNKQGK